MADILSKPRAGANGDWIRACAVESLRDAGRKVVKLGGKQIALFWHDNQVLACNNRCPHEGYPLIEGSLASRSGVNCALTCNWHSWAFDLRDGANLTGGDRLRTYPVDVVDGHILVDVSDTPTAERQARALEALRGGFTRLDHGRVAREAARYQAADGDPIDCVRAAIDWTHDRFEFGTTHAHAAMPDWLTLRDDHAQSPAEGLSALTEALFNLGWDSLREPQFPFASGSESYDAGALVAAIEALDEASGGAPGARWPG